jgi:hypothetical protein
MSRIKRVTVTIEMEDGEVHQHECERPDSYDVTVEDTRTTFAVYHEPAFNMPTRGLWGGMAVGVSRSRPTFRRLDTAQALAAGVLDRPATTGPVPLNRPVEQVDGTPSDEAWVVDQMAAGRVLSASNYFGIPYVWAEADHWRGCLLQYREVVEDMTFDDAEKAAAWFVERCRETEG